jgi:predicted nucleic acid-binding protein
MVFVLDASVTLNWYFADEIAPAADAAFAGIATRDAVVPVLWWFEIRNALVMNERRGRLDAARTVEILAHLETLPIRADSAQDSETILALARMHRLTVYDAAYVELARRLDAPLATLDQALAAAARAAAISLLGENGTGA